MRLLVAAALIGSALCSAAATKPAAAPVTSVMIVGGYHMSNPGHDLHDVHADDVLAPRRQKEIVAITNALARFHPTKVAVEWDAPVVAERYPKYLAGTLPPSRNEVVQLGFRLANTAHAQGDDVHMRLDPVDREELRKLTESVTVRHAVDPHVMRRMVELGYARAVVGGWEITEAGWHVLERSRIPNALK